MPRTQEQKEAFFEYLKSRDLFWAYASVNSQALNAFYKAEFDAAMQDGDLDFSIPGIDEPDIVETIQMRKK